jgi:hypothetical protein
MPPRTATKPRPLSDEERKNLQDLLERDSATKGPAVRIGDPYVALTNLSVPRRGGDGSTNDLVRPGETVHLTQEEAAGYMRHGPGDGRRVSVIMPASEYDAQAAAGKLPPRAFSGALRQPPADARPDPAGSSHIQQAQPRIPEAAEPQPGSEATGGQETSAAQQLADAMDIRVTR